MKNIFFIHSNITLLSSIAVIQYEKITCPILIIVEEYNSPLFNTIDYKRIQLPAQFTYLLKSPSYGTNNILKLFYMITQLDSFFKTITKNSEFSLFIPHSKTLFYQLLITNKKCTNLHYIDEGLLSYTNKFHKDHIAVEVSVLKKYIKLNYFNRINIFRKIKKNYTTVYQFVDQMEKNNKAKIIPWPSLLKDETINLDNAIVLVLDNPVYGDVCSRSDYNKYLEKVITHLGSGKVYIKNHPREKNIDEIVSILNCAGICYEILDDSVILETLLLNSTNVQIYGGWSSILFYATAMNHQVYSFIKTIAATSPSSAEWFDKCLPSVFCNPKMNLL
jgi:hypothetical protein